jgi:uncharacterized membrane-anchored protein
MAKSTAPIDPAELVAGKMMDLGLDPERPNDEYSAKIRFQQSRRQAEAEARKSAKA